MINLRLRLANLEDIEKLQSLSQENQEFHFYSDRLLSRDQQREVMIEKIKESNIDGGIYVIEDEKDKEMVASFFLYSTFFRNGYTFLHIDVLRKSREVIGLDVLKMMIRYCFQELNLNKLNVYIRSRYIKEMDIFLEAGFQIEVILNEHFYSEGYYEDIYQIGLTKEDYWNRTLREVEKRTINEPRLDQDYLIRPDIPPVKSLLVGEKVELREVIQEDIEKIYQQCEGSDEKSYASIAAAVPTSRSSLQNLTKIKNDYRSFKEGPIFAIREKGGDIVGTIGANMVENKNRNLMIGLGIFNQSNRGKGYGREAIELFTDFAFLEMNMHRVHLGCFSFNEGAYRLYKRLGFIPEGINRGFVYRNGKYYDEYVLGVLKEDWMKKRGYL